MSVLSQKEMLAIVRDILEERRDAALEETWLLMDGAGYLPDDIERAIATYRRRLDAEMIEHLTALIRHLPAVRSPRQGTRDDDGR